MLPVATKRRRPSKRLSMADSARLLRSAKEYLPRVDHGRVKMLSEIFGCARRTASRLLHTPEDKIPKLRKSYLDTAVKYLQVPATRLLTRPMPNPTFPKSLDIMARNDIPALDRFREMAQLAHTMAARCMFGFDMPASVTVQSDANSDPMAIRMTFRKQNCGAEHEVAIVRDPFYTWRMVYNRDIMGEQFRGDVTEENFDRILLFVQNNTK